MWDKLGERVEINGERVESDDERVEVSHERVEIKINRNKTNSHASLKVA